MIKVNFRYVNFTKDIERLFIYMMKEENQLLFSHSFQIHTLSDFERWLSEKLRSNEYHDFFIIENTNEEAIGFTFSYNFFSNDLHCKYTLCLYEEYQNRGYGAISAITMMDYLFSKYPLRQIFISIFDYNRNSLMNNLKGGFTEVGVLPEYRYSNGNFHSLHLLTISRETFYNRFNKIISNINT